MAFHYYYSDIEIEIKFSNLEKIILVNGIQIDATATCIETESDFKIICDKNGQEIMKMNCNSGFSIFPMPIELIGTGSREFQQETVENILQYFKNPTMYNNDSIHFINKALSKLAPIIISVFNENEMLINYILEKELWDYKDIVSLLDKTKNNEMRARILEYCRTHRPSEPMLSLD